MHLRPGTLFHERYEIVGPLGQGGMGMVYRAHDRTLDEDVAIKVLRPEFAEAATMAERFKSEIKLARKVRHRNVCAIHDFGEDRGTLYISMELIDGVDLKRCLREGGALPPEEAFGVAIQVAEGLEAVHAAGIIHRDLKTSNIIVDKAGVARLMDFGIAKRQEGSGALTAAGLVLGTPEYMSPEQAQGKRVDARTDLYALGVVIYEIFAGDVPFRGETPIATILKQINDPPPLDSQRLPERLRPVLRKALAKDPAARHQTANAVAVALRDASRAPRPLRPAAATEVIRPPAPPPPQPPRARSLRLWLLALPIVAAVALVLGLRSPSEPRIPVPAPEAAATTPPGPAPATAPMETVPPALEPSIATAPPTVARSSLPTPHARPVATQVPEPAPSTSLAASTIPPPVPAAPSTTAPAQPGLLQLAVRPWAEVHVDGRPLGTTPLDKVSLPSGTHTVVLRHPSFEPLSHAVTIRPGELTKLLVDLSREGTRRRD